MTHRAATSPAGTAALVSEKAFAATVVELARVCGFMVYHTWLSIRSPKGFPDLVLAREPRSGERAGRLIFAELKRQSGRVSMDQARWLLLLGQCPGVESYVFRPGDWDKIVEVLRR